MQVDSKPEELDELDRRIDAAQDRARGAEEGDGRGLQGPAGKLEKELAELEEQSAALTARWQAEKDKLGDAQKIKEELEARAQRARAGAAQGRSPSGPAS